MITISIDPVAFHLGSFEVRWYGIFVAIAVVALTLWMYRQITTHKDRIPRPDPIVAVIAIACGLGMAKLFHVVDLWGYYSQNLGEIFSTGGLGVFGAIVGASLFFWIYSRKHDYPFWFISDLAAPGVILAQAIGRIGCLVNGCCYGKLCQAGPDSLPWGVIYTHPNSYAPLGVELIPTQLYEIIFNFTFFGVLFKLRGRLKPDGSLFLLYLAGYAAWRIGISFLRQGTPFFFGLQEAQIISIAILAVVLPALVIRMRRAARQS